MGFFFEKLIDRRKDEQRGDEEEEEEGVDDEYLDPLVFNSNSSLGVPGLMSAYRKGNIVSSVMC